MLPLVRWCIGVFCESTGVVGTYCFKRFLQNGGIGLVSKTKPNMLEKKQSNTSLSQITGVIFCGGVVHDMKGNSVNSGNESPSFRICFGLDIGTNTR